MFDWLRRKIERRKIERFIQQDRLWDNRYGAKMAALLPEAQKKVVTLTRVLTQASNIVRYEFGGRFNVLNFDSPEMIKQLCVAAIHLLEQEKVTKC